MKLMTTKKSKNLTCKFKNKFSQAKWEISPNSNQLNLPKMIPIIKNDNNYNNLLYNAQKMNLTRNRD